MTQLGTRYFNRYHKYTPMEPTMRHVKLALFTLAAALPFAFSPSPAVEAKPGDVSAWDGKTFTAHEWGTFTSVQGSDGVVLDGLRHEERDLPKFVHDIRDFAGITGVSPKMETPVIYFYSDKERNVRVNVKFPRGLITQWYPAAHSVNLQGLTVNGGAEKPDGREITDLKDGFISWGDWNDLRVLAPGATEDNVLDREKGGRIKVKFELPAVAKDDPWRFCREVDANTVRACSLNAARRADNNGGAQRVINEYEKCLFYRGLGDFALPLKATVTSEHVGRRGGYAEVSVGLTLENLKPEEALGHLLLIWTRDGETGFSYIGDMPQKPELHRIMVLEKTELAMEELVKLLAEKLSQTGLFYKEALAMAHTWKEGYFKDEGLRVLYVLPTQFVDRELPLAISAGDAGTYGMPKNDKTFPVVRTFVARCELLSPEREAAMTALVESAAGGDKEALAAIEKWGRFAIPYFNRLKALSKNDAVLKLVDKQLEELKLRR